MSAVRVRLRADEPVVLELPFLHEERAKRALLRGVYRRAARTLRNEVPEGADTFEEIEL